MLPLLGGTIGGALFLLAAVIAVCCLLRSRKQRHTDGSAVRPSKGHYRNQDPEQGEDAVMEGNPLYSSYDGGVDYAHIGGARQTASTKDPQASPGTSHEVADIYAIPDKQRPSTLNDPQASPGTSQEVADIYAIPDKQRPSTLNDPQASPGTSQEVADIYAIPDKQRSSTLNDYHCFLKRRPLPVMCTASYRNNPSRKARECHTNRRTKMRRPLPVMCTASYRNNPSRKAGECHTSRRTKMMGLLNVMCTAWYRNSPSERVGQCQSTRQTREVRCLSCTARCRSHKIMGSKTRSRL
ncbi:uncharacterized protein LOC124148331 [Haliotis rufescens]|uniref:uncharacterized protein LOC124148331 n=1 Tax=Haliotis rufescens TaxID=6454 RepID=UPI00201E8A56|nr:uncharacterized protein LOC124148331 [Haliotis rufescens]